VTRAASVVALVVIPLAVSAVVDLALLAREGGDVPTERDYLDARAAMLRDGFDPETDVVAILPAWSLRPLVHMKDLPWITGDLLDERPLDRHRRVYVFVEPDGEDAFADVEARGFPTATVENEGKVTLARLDVGGPSVSLDFARDIARAEVRIVDRAGEVRATCGEPARGGFRCTGRKAWQRATRERHLVSENGDEVVWVHPPSPGEILELRFADVVLGDDVVLRAGHTRTGADKAVAPVDVEIVFEGERLHRATRAPRFHFATERVDTRSQKGARGTLALRISTTNDASQHFAIDGFVVGDARQGAARSRDESARSRE